MIRLLFVFGIIISSTPVSAQFSLGANIGKSNEFTFGDFNSFDLSGPDIWNLERYGIGRGAFEIQKDRVGASGDARSGAFIIHDSTTNLALGAELGAGSVGYHNKPEYEWEPALSVGYLGRCRLLKVYAGPRAGLSYNNMPGNTDFTGWVGQIETSTLAFTYWKNNYDKGPPLEIIDITLNQRYNIQERLQQNQKTLLLGVKFRF